MNILIANDGIVNFVSLFNSFVVRTNINLLFYLKKRPTYKNGPVAIYLRFTVDGQKAEASTGKTCDPSGWNTQAGRAIGTKEGVRSLNSYLDTLQAKAQEFHRWMTANDEIITAESLKIVLLVKQKKHAP
jgi:hypothetical protein